MSYSLSQRTANDVNFKIEYHPETMLTLLELEHEAVGWLIAELTPDQMRSLVAFWHRVDPGEAWRPAKRSELST